MLCLHYRQPESLHISRQSNQSTTKGDKALGDKYTVLIPYRRHQKKVFHFLLLYPVTLKIKL